MEKAELIDIIQKSKDGDMEAMEKLLLYAHTSVSYQCRKMLRNEQDVEDMTQEILVTVYQKLDSLKEPAAFNQWLKKITATRCINVLTRTHIELQFAEDEEGNSILNTLEEMDEKKIPDKWLDNKETTRMIEEIVNGLPDVQRLCTLMFYYSEMSVKEIAYALKVSENTIKSRLNYARKAIKERVLDYEKKGVKLYGLSPLPFLFYFLHKREDEEKDPVAAQIMVDEILVQSAFAIAGVVNVATSAATSTTNTVAAVGTAAAAGSAATAGASSTGIAAVLSAIPPKIVAGVAAALVFVGGTIAAIPDDSNSGEEITTPTVLVEEQDGGCWDDGIIFEEPESTSETEASEEKMIPEKEETVPEETKAENNAASNGNQSDTSDNSSSDNENPSQTDSTETTTPTESPEEETAPSEPTEDELKVHTHTYAVNYTLEPCCAIEGCTQYRCTSCGQWYEEYTDKLQHNYAKTVIAPTAYSRGYTKYECATQCNNHIHSNGTHFCHDTYMADYTEKLSADSDTSGCQHSFTTTITLQATCYNEGIQKSTCESCGFSYTEVIPTYAEHEWHPSTTYPPSCTFEGYECYVCNYCSEEKRESTTPVLGHDYTTTIVQPTESALGYTEFACNRCGNTFKDNYTEFTEGYVSMHTHNYTSQRVDPSCDSLGLITYTCECGHVYYEEISCTEHTIESKVVEPSETALGYIEYTCTICGYTYQNDFIGYTLSRNSENGSGTETHTHEYIVSYVKAPCCCYQPRSNYSNYVCTICGDSYSSDFVEQLPHNYKETTIVEPTVYSQGYTIYRCTNICEGDHKENGQCDAYYIADYTDKLPAGSDTVDCTHEFSSEITQNSTCKTEGILSYSCNLCGFSYTEIIPVTEHDWYQTAGREADCLYDGYEPGYSCSICNEYQSGATIPALGHNYTTVVIAPTTTSMGYTEFSCQRCGISFTDHYTEMLDDGTASSHTHDYSCEVIEPVCGTNYKVYSCECGHTYEADHVEIPHNWEAVVVPPTETAQGYTYEVCSTCGASTSPHNYTDPIAVMSISEEKNSDSHSHSYTRTVTSSTCTTGGYTTYQCSCGDNYVVDEIEATGHSYTSAVVNPTETEQGYTKYICSVCGDSYRDNYTDLQETE